MNTPLVEQSHRLPVRGRVNSAISAIPVVLFSAAVLYLFNSVSPFLTFNDINSRFFWLEQISLFVAYVVLTLAIWVYIGWSDYFLNGARYSSIFWRILFGTVAIASLNGAVLTGIVAPLFRLLMMKDWPNLVSTWIGSSILGIAAYTCLLMHRAGIEKRAQTLHAQLEMDTLDAALDRAELSMLEAQLEPHFLFNTLAHIKLQYRDDSNTAADQLLSALIEYIDRALPALRREDWTVGDELGLVQTYLGILVQRFGSRLQFSITAPESSKMVSLPALTITTLVENAVRHGLAPKPEGGMVSINAQSIGTTLHIEVRDSGIGLRGSSGGGLGLATVRARLRIAFGNRFSLIVEPGDSNGVRASIIIPIHD